LQYIPVKKAWEEPLSNKQYQRTQILTLFVAIGAFNLVTDVIIVLLPLPVVLRLHTNWKNKGMHKSMSWYPTWPQLLLSVAR
jgi:hypothetical protein